MEEIVYLSVRIGCAGYLLYKLWNQKKRIRKICGLLYTPGKKGFTLVELIVVLVILAILAALLIQIGRAHV